MYELQQMFKEKEEEAPTNDVNVTHIESKPHPLLRRMTTQFDFEP
jgi:hypothetical protein